MRLPVALICQIVLIRSVSAAARTDVSSVELHALFGAGYRFQEGNA